VTGHFSSTDDARTGAPLRWLRRFEFDGSFALELGGSLPAVTCAFETWGELNTDKSNAVLICHAISGDSHVTRHAPDDDPGWWEDLVGPARPIDTNRFFVICPNILGGCRGTTGPISINPATGEPFGPDFPSITIGDMVRLQVMLIDRLGIGQLRGVVGGSLGGHQALTWATRFADRVRTCIAIATSPRLTSQALAFDVVARNAIQTDPHFHDGRYYGRPAQPSTGLAIARMLGHITYLSSEAMDAKFDPDRLDPRDIETAFEKRFSVGSYLAYQGHRFVERFDANSYLRISMAMDLFDLGRTPEQLRATLAAATCDFLVVSFSSDWLFTPRQSRDIVQALTALQKSITYCEVTTAAGHDAFLLPDEIGRYGGLVAAKIGVIDDPPPAEKVEDDRILDLIGDGENVLDLGCGEGELLSRLKRRGEPTGRVGRLCGIEVDQARIVAAARRGLDVIDYDLNDGLPGFADRDFDVVVLSATMQSIWNVEGLIRDMLRVGRRAIVSFPNFAHRELRETFYRTGRLPKAPGPYAFEWYNTPNRRFPSILDFEDFCRDRGIEVQRRVFLDSQRSEPVIHDPNLNADLAIFVISRAGSRFVR
jgi:homoserine O-acetyltransferase